MTQRRSVVCDSFGPTLFCCSHVLADEMTSIKASKAKEVGVAPRVPQKRRLSSPEPGPVEGSQSKRMNHHQTSSPPSAQRPAPRQDPLHPVGQRLSARPSVGANDGRTTAHPTRRKLAASADADHGKARKTQLQSSPQGQRAAPLPVPAPSARRKGGAAPSPTLRAQLSAAFTPHRSPAAPVVMDDGKGKVKEITHAPPPGASRDVVPESRRAMATQAQRHIDSMPQASQPQLMQQARHATDAAKCRLPVAPQEATTIASPKFRVDKRHSENTEQVFRQSLPLEFPTSPLSTPRATHSPVSHKAVAPPKQIPRRTADKRKDSMNELRQPPPTQHAQREPKHLPPAPRPKPRPAQSAPRKVISSDDANARLPSPYASKPSQSPMALTSASPPRRQLAASSKIAVPSSPPRRHAPSPPLSREPTPPRRTLEKGKGKMRVLDIEQQFQEIEAITDRCAETDFDGNQTHDRKAAGHHRTYDYDTEYHSKNQMDITTGLMKEKRLAATAPSTMSKVRLQSKGIPEVSKKNWHRETYNEDEWETENNVW